MDNVRVLLVSDRIIQREGFRLLLGRTPDIRVVGEAGDKAEALAIVEQTPVDVVLIDMAISGLEITRQLKETYPEIAVLVMIEEETDPYLFDLLAVGASGCIASTSASDELISAIREARDGDMHLSSSAARILVENYLRRVDKSEEKTIHSGLTRREWEILTYVVADKHNKEIARLLGISIRTVQSHRTSLMEKLGVHGSIQLVRYAIRKGIVRP